MGSTPLEQARALLDIGFAVIPVPHGSKAPALKDWPHVRVTPETVSDYFDGKAENVGGLCGEPSGGRVDIDLDCAEARSLAHHLLPATGLIHGRPGAPSSHYWYISNPVLTTTRYRDPLCENERAMLVEYRSTGTQTLLPPSTHPCGEQYRWDHQGTPATVDGHELLAAVRKLAAACLLVRYYPPEGSRHDAMLALGGGLLRGDWSVEEATAFISAVAVVAGDDEVADRARAAGYTQTRLDNDQAATGWPTLLALMGRRVVDQVREWLDLRDVRDCHRAAAVPPFPLEALPAGLRALVTDAAESMVAPVDYLAVGCLVTAGAAIGNALELELKHGYREGANLNAVIVGDPGSKKSPALNLATRGLRHVQHEQACEHTAAMERYDEALAEWEGAKKPGRGPRPKPPVYPQVFTTDATVEALAPMLATSKGILLHRDEAVSWVKSMDAYRNGRGGDKQHYLSMWSRTAIKVDRKGGVPIFVVTPFISVLGGIQPDLLPELADVARREDGFLDRLLWSYPDPVPDRWNPRGLNPERTQEMQGAISRLHALPFIRESGGDEPRSRTIRLGPEAQALWVEWYENHVMESQAEAFPATLKGPWAKMPAQLARLALILHAVHAAEQGADEAQALNIPPAISCITLAAAADLVDYFKAHARRVYQHLDRQQRDVAVRVLQALQEHGELTTSELEHKVFHGHGGARLHRALDELEGAGLIRRYTRDGRETGGRSATVWVRT
jgi:hypothetical protein